MSSLPECFLAGLDHRLWLAAAGTLHAPPSGLVCESGDEFLAGGGLAGDQDRHVGRRHLLDLAEDALRRGAAADQPALAVHLDVDGFPAGT